MLKLLNAYYYYYKQVSILHRLDASSCKSRSGIEARGCTWPSESRWRLSCHQKLYSPLIELAVQNKCDYFQMQTSSMKFTWVKCKKICTRLCTNFKFSLWWHDWTSNPTPWFCVGVAPSRRPTYFHGEPSTLSRLEPYRLLLATADCLKDVM